MLSKILSIITVLALTASTAVAGNKARTGTAGATELLIPVSARNMALNNAFVSELKGIDGLEVNPASIAILGSTELYFSSLNYLADIKMLYLGTGVKFDEWGNFAFNIRSLDFGDIDRTTNENIFGTGESFSPTYVTIGVAYGKEMTENVQFGVQLKYAHESFYNVTASGLGMDIGFQYSGVSILPGLNFGIALKNINLNKMKFEGQGLRIVNDGKPDGSSPLAVGKSYTVPAEAFDMPTSFEFGISYNAAFSDQVELSLASSYQNNNVSFDHYNFGGELSYDKLIFLRAGYRLIPEAEDYPFGPTYGIGIAHNIGFDFELDYAYRTVEYFPSANQMISFKIKL